MIEVQNLTKRYGQHGALDGVSFSVGCGEVVGFLGPNGAGKSTTMRILTTFMAATSGSVRVGGDCVFELPMRVRERIGYMPENNPLPTDLRVGDYLKFRAQLKRLANGDSANRIAEVMEQCGVADVAGRFIGQLSRGYRQRVGLADALLAKPELIVLDEPTAGLDPNQVRSVRRLIRELAGGHTVLISSHILSEIEMTCDRVVILHEGRLLASGALEELMTKANAAVSYYGVMLMEHIGETINAPLILHVPTEDQFVSPEQQAEVRAALEGNDKVTIYDYQGQGHAFARVGGQHYHQASAEAARERTLDLFKTHLG